MIWENWLIWITDIKTDFHEGFVKDIIVASNNYQTDKQNLPKRYLPALKTNSNIIILTKMLVLL